MLFPGTLARLRISAVVLLPWTLDRLRVGAVVLFPWTLARMRVACVVPRDISQAEGSLCCSLEH